jgi:hypothetical protein
MNRLFSSPSGNSDSQSELRRIVSTCGTNACFGAAPGVFPGATVTPRTIERSVV